MTLRNEILGRVDCEALVTAKDCHAIASLISVNRTKLKETMITERGVRGAMDVSSASQFLRLLKQCAESTVTPEWLTPVLNSLGVPVAMHIDYADALASAHGWLRQGAGLDLGSAATRGMLDIIAASDTAKFGTAVSKLKSLAMTPDVVHFRDVAIALYNDDGTPK